MPLELHPLGLDMSASLYTPAGIALVPVNHTRSATARGVVESRLASQEAELNDS